MAEVIGPDTPKEIKGTSPRIEDPTAQKAWERLQKARGSRKAVEGGWKTWERYYHGHHFDKPRAPWKTRKPKNFIFSTIESTLPIMTDNAPQITVVPTEPSDTNISEIIGNIVKRVWTDQDMDIKLPDILKNTLIYGTGFAKVWWNPTLKNGLGDVAISVVDPYHIFPSPGATSFCDAEYVLFAANLPLSRVIQQYPEAETFYQNGQLKPGPWDSSLTHKKPVSTDDSDNYNVVNTTISYQNSATTFQKIPRVGSASEGKSEIVTLVEMWDRDPSGAAQVTVVCNGCTLRPTFRPFKYQGFPFIRFVDYPIPGEFFGMGDVQQLKPVQDLINERSAQIHDILNLTANPQFLADTNSGINTKALVNRPGVLIWKQPGTEARWNNPPQFPSGLFEAQQFDKQDYDNISGIQDVTQGRRPTGIEAASAIVELQEAAQTRIRGKTRLMEASMREMGKQIISLVQQFYTEQRAVRVVGKQQVESQFVTVNKPVPDGFGGVAKINDLSVGEYDLEIGVGSTLPVSKTRKFSQFLQMFRDGLVDQQAVLEQSGLSPDEIAVIVSRMQQQQQMMMQAQMQQEGGSPSPADQTGTAQAEQGALENTNLPSEDELRQIEEEQGRTTLGV